MAQFIAFVVAVYCYAQAFRTYLLQEPLMYFYKAGPLKTILPIWQHCRIGIWLFTGI